MNTGTPQKERQGQTYMYVRTYVHIRISVNTQTLIEILRSVYRQGEALDDWKGSRGHALNAAFINITLDHEVAIETP
jgi:hypothetical protein